MIAAIKRKVDDSPLIKNIGILVSGTFLAQFVYLLASPLLSRLYTKEDFGALGSLLAIAGLISVVASLKYEMALVVEDDDAKAQHLQFLCFVLLVLVSSLVLLASFWVPGNIPLVDDNPLLNDLLPICGLIVFLSGFYNILKFRITREKAYWTLTRADVFQKISTALLQVFLGVLGLSVWGLAWGYAFGFLVAIVIMVSKEKAVCQIIKSRYSECLDVAREHYRFAAYAAPQNFLNFFSQNLPVFLLGFYYGLGVVGSYWFAMRILQLPLTLVSGAVRQVFYKEAVDLKNTPELLLSKFKKITATLAVLIIIPALTIITFGSDLFILIFGESWEQAGQFSSLMMLWLTVGFINPPAVTIFNALNLQHISLFLDVVLFCLRGISLLLGGLYLDASETIALYSLAGFVMNVIVIVVAYSQISKRRVGDCIR